MQFPPTSGQPQMQVQKLPTGIEGFDDVCQGGLPIGRSTLISGTSGTGKTVFSSPLPASVLRKHLTEIPRRLCARRPELPEALGMCVDRLLAKDPDLRPAHPAALVTELEQLAADIGKPAQEPRAPRLPAARRDTVEGPTSDLPTRRGTR